MPMERNPDYINEAHRQLKERVIQSGIAYAADNQESKKLNKSRSKRRADIKEMGFRTDSYQQAVYAAKNLTPSEAKDFFRDMKTIYEWLSAKQQDLFPEEQLAAQKREQRRKDKEKRDAEAKKVAESQQGVDASTNKRSDPKTGGAGGVNGRAPAKDKAPAKAKDKATEEADPPAPSTPKTVTAEGAKNSEAMVKDAIARVGQKAPGQPGDGSKADIGQQEQAEGDQALKSGLPLSQSAQAAAKRDAAGMGGKV